MTMGDPADLADRLEGVIAGADPALMDDEIDAIGEAIEFLRGIEDDWVEDAEGIDDPHHNLPEADDA